MPTLHQRIVELEKRLTAIEARQLMWRHDAASRAGKPDSVSDAALADIISSSRDVMKAVTELRRSVQGDCAAPERRRPIRLLRARDDVER
jgi:hypothetical protein